MNRKFLKKFYPEGLESVKKEVDHGRDLLFLTDYDGTLVSFTDVPDKTSTPDELLNMLSELKEQPVVKLAVISGRPLSDLRRLVPISGIIKAGLHGMVIQDGEDVMYMHHGCDDLRPIISEFRKALSREFSDREGVFLEDKELALALHYRMFQGDELRVEEDFMNIFELLNPGELEVIRGNKVLEIRPKGWHKGTAVRVFLERYGGNCVCIYFGDDITDEDAFEELQEVPYAFSVKVMGQSHVQTSAEYYVEGVDSVRRSIKDLVDFLKDEE